MYTGIGDSKALNQLNEVKSQTFNQSVVWLYGNNWLQKVG